MSNCSYPIQGPAPITKPVKAEEISKEDWLSIRDSLSLESDRGELERIKEDRVEYQEVWANR